MYFGTRQQRSFCSQMVENIHKLTDFTAFPSKSNIFTVFTPFTTFTVEWPPCLMLLPLT